MSKTKEQRLKELRKELNIVKNELRYAYNELQEAEAEVHEKEQMKEIIESRINKLKKQKS